MINKQLYKPSLIPILGIKNENKTVKTFRLEVDEDFRPGQFFQVSVLGEGEVPISISSSPKEKGFIELTVRLTGKVTKAIHSLKKGSFIGLRGPYGSFFSIDDAEEREIIIVAGGIGLAPLRSVIRSLISERRRFGRIHLLYGAKEPSEMIFKAELRLWRQIEEIDVLLTVDNPDTQWRGNVGVVTTLFDKIDLSSNSPIAFVCGPPIMMKYTVYKLLELGLKENDIYLTLERYMKCGVGKCGHCYLGNKYVCLDGPVFSYKELKEIKVYGELI